MSTDVERLPRIGDDAGSGRRVAGTGARRSQGVVERRILITLTLAAAVLRFATLNVQSVWLDESATIVLVRHSLTGMLSHLSASESTPPLYYILVWVWTRVFGVGVLGFRSFSALIGTLTVPVLYIAGRQISRRAAFWAAALTVVNPAMYYYSQEARCYILLVFFSAIAFIYWLRALDEPDRRNLWLWSVLSAAALLTHYFALFLFIPEALTLAWRHGIRRILTPTSAVVVVGLALVPLASSEIGSGGGKVGWIEDSSLPSRVAETVKEFLVGVYGPLELVSAAIAGLLTLAALVLVIRRADTRERRIVSQVAIVGLVGIVIPLLPAAAHILDVFDGRNVLAIWIPVGILVAVGLGARRSGRTGVILGVLLCVISVAVIAGINALPAYQRDDWRGAAQAVAAGGAGATLVAEQNSFTPLSIYVQRLHLIASAAGAKLEVRIRTREVDFVTLRARGSAGGSPSAPVVERRPPPGFHLVQIKRSTAYAVSRFLAPRPISISVAQLRQTVGDSSAEVMAQR